MNHPPHEAGFLLAQQLIQAGILEELSPEKIRHLAPQGAILITCGDRDRITGHLSGCQRIVDIHLIALNGGAILLGEGVDEKRKHTIIEECHDAMYLKEIHFIFSLSHFPCGKGDLLGMSLQQNILANLQGKDVLKASFLSIGIKVRVLPIVSIDWRESGLANEDGVRLYGTKRNKVHAIKHFDPAKHVAHRKPHLSSSPYSSLNTL